MLRAIWYNPLFRTVLGLYTLGMGWCYFAILHLHLVPGWTAQGIVAFGTLFLVAWLITKFALSGADHAPKD